MPIIRKSLKYGIPIGITYLSVEQKLWSPLTQQEINDKYSSIGKYKKQIEVYMKDTFSLQLPDYMKIPDISKLSDVKSLWNCGVKITFNTFNDFDFKNVIQKVEKLFETKTKSK